MRVRTAIARWLSPELARRADEAVWLHNQISEAKWWLVGDFPVVGVVLDYLTIGLANHFRPLDEPALLQEYPNGVGVWPWEISSFREKLKKVFKP